MENAILYTFSTIPQTLGAAFAVLSAFVIYRFAADASVERDIAELMQIFTPEYRADLRATLEDRGLTHLLAEMSELFDAGSVSAPGYGSHQFETLLRLRAAAGQADVKAPLRRAFLWTGGVIVASVVALGVEKLLAAQTEYAVAALVLGVLGLTRCLWLYWKLIDPLIAARRW
jgi:hypothetical protein